MESTTAQATRAFVDSSVLMAAVLSSRGSARDLIRLGIERQVVLVLSSFVLDEVERNVSRKSPNSIMVLKRMLEECPFETSEPTSGLVEIEMEHVEPKDAEIVAAAVAGNVDFLVTYDARHLLAQAVDIGARHGIVVCPPAVLLCSMGESV